MTLTDAHRYTTALDRSTTTKLGQEYMSRSLRNGQFEVGFVVRETSVQHPTPLVRRQCLKLVLNQ